MMEITSDTMVEDMFNIRTHNGTITVKSVRTGDHRTFRVRTLPADSKFAAGKRIVEMLEGPDNESDYRGFAFVVEHRSRQYQHSTDSDVMLGYSAQYARQLAVWKKKRGTVYDTYADMLVNPAKWVGRAEYLFEGRCRVCDRKLTTPESITSGIGPVCAGKQGF